MRKLSLLFLSVCLSSCSPGGKSDRTTDPTIDDAPEVSLDGKADGWSLGFGDWEQDPQYLVTMELYRTEFMYMSLYANNGYMRTRCLNDGCTQRAGDQGSLKFSRSSSGITYVRFYKDTTFLDRYAYDIDGDTLWLRRSGTRDWFPMLKGGWSEAKCDDSGGSWTDDDTAPDATFCVCDSGTVYTAATGCTPVEK